MFTWSFISYLVVIFGEKWQLLHPKWFLSSLKVTIFPHRVTWFEAVCHLILTDVFPTRIHLKTFSHSSILSWIEWKRRMWMSSNIIGLQVKIICMYLINKRHGSRTLEQTIWLWIHTSHTEVYFNEFVANALRSILTMSMEFDKNFSNWSKYSTGHKNGFEKRGTGFSDMDAGHLTLFGFQMT